MPALPRALRRKRVVVPVATVLVAVTGFVGYGAYTRSKPITYSRGGNEFAVVSPEQPVTAPTAEASATADPSPAVTPSPSTSADPQPGTTATVAPAETAAAPEPSAAPTAVPAPEGVAVPKAGAYGLKVEGSESVKFGAVGFCDQDLPATTTLVVSKAPGESATSYDFDLGYFPGQAGKHDERHLYRYAKDAVFLDYEVATVTCQGVRQSSEVEYAPPQRRLPLPLKVGTSFSYTGGSADRHIESTSKVVRTETLTVAGQSVLTYVVQSDEDFSGNESGTRSQTWWYAPSWAMPVKWTEQISGGRSGASYREDVTVTVTSRP